MSTESPSFDIIIPVFNTQKDLLAKCLDSACNQSYSNYNVIVIDDGSENKDTLEVLNYYKKEYSVKLIRKSNSGSADARNVGLEHSDAEFFLFLDSDDYLRMDILHQLANKIRKYSCDIIFYGLIVEKNGKIIRKNMPDKNLTMHDVISMSEKSLAIWGNSSVCAKCFSAKLRDVRFVRGLCYGEDKIYLFELYRKYQMRISSLANEGYVHVKNPYSMTKNYDERSVGLIKNYCCYFYDYCLPMVDAQNRNYVCYKMLFESVVSLLNAAPISDKNMYNLKMSGIFCDTTFVKIISDSAYVAEDPKDKKIIFAIQEKRYILARSYQNDFLKKVIFKLARVIKNMALISSI